MLYFFIYHVWQHYWLTFCSRPSSRNWRRVQKSHRTQNKATRATEMTLSTTASSQLWFFIALQFVVTLASMEWQCQMLPKQGCTVTFAQIETACGKGTVHNPAAATVHLDFHVYSESTISDICFFVANKKKQRNIEHYTIQYHKSQTESLGT